MLIEQEGDVAGFLGERIEQNKSGLLEMKQEGLTDHGIEELSLDVGTVNGKATPAEVKLIVKDTNGGIANSYFCYSSVVDMMLYYSDQSKSDIVCVVNCAACYVFCSRHSHELALKRIGRYLKATC